MDNGGLAGFHRHPRGSWARGDVPTKTATPRPILGPPLRLPGLPAGTDSTAIYRRGGGGVGARRAGSGTGRRPQLLGGCAPKLVQPHGAVCGGTGIGPQPLCEWRYFSALCQCPSRRCNSGGEIQAGKFSEFSRIKANSGESGGEIWPIWLNFAFLNSLG